MLIVLLILGSYLIGSVPFGVILTRMKGIDIFSVGSGNPGATNVWRAAGPGIGATVFALDVLKGLAPAMLGHWLTGDPLVSLGCGVAAIVGHTLSPFLKFKGGKGISTGLGALLGSAPLVAAIVLGSFIVVFAISRYVSLSSIAAAVALGVTGFALHLPLSIALIYAALTVFIIYRHRANVKRLLNGTEPRFKFKGRGEGSKSPSSEAASSDPDDPLPADNDCEAGNSLGPS